MKTSFVIIAYNEERNIAATLDSIFAQDNLQDYEVVVVNDGSRDRTLQLVQAVAREYPELKIVDLQPNKGRGAARAAGLAAAQGDYLAFVDADIVLPKDWLSRCMSYMSEYDACGGIAVPDGDVAWVHRVFKLSPKVAPHTTKVSGGNGLFKRAVFEKIGFDPNKRNGEDVDLGYQIDAAGLNTTSIRDLLVEHHETKTYGESLSWLFESGVGASRQFYEHKQVRLPDLAFFGFVIAMLVTIIGGFFIPTSLLTVLIILDLLYVSASSAMHLFTKFNLSKTLVRSVFGVIANMTLLVSYYLGRSLGMITEWRK